MTKNNGIGSSLDDWLKEEGIFDEVKEAADKKLAKLRKQDTKPKPEKK